MNEQELKWPDTTPPDLNDQFSQSMGLSDGTTHYKKAEVEPGKWRWVIDEDAMSRMRAREKHRSDLYFALRSRVLSEAEMKEVEEYGDYLNTPSGVPYNPEQKSRELNSALLQQFRLREIARTQSQS